MFIGHDRLTQRCRTNTKKYSRWNIASEVSILNAKDDELVWDFVMNFHFYFDSVTVEQAVTLLGRLSILMVIPCFHAYGLLVCDAFIFIYVYQTIKMDDKMIFFLNFFIIDNGQYVIVRC